MTHTDAAVSSKDDLVRHTTARWDAFVAFIDRLPDAQWTTPTDPAGWTARDHVAHVTIWDLAVIEQLRSKTPPQQVLHVADATWNAGTDAINEALRQRTANDPVAVVKANRDRVWTELLAVLSGMTEEELAGPGGAYHLDQDGKPLRDVLVGYLAGHYDHHGEYIAHLVRAHPAKERKGPA